MVFSLRASRIALHAAALLILCVSMLQPAMAQLPAFTWPTVPAAPSVIPDRYIVVLKTGETASPADILKDYRSSLPQLFPAIRGFAATMNKVEALKLMADPRVAIVEPDVTVYAFAYCPPALQRWCGSSSSARSSSISSRSSSAASSVTSSVASSAAGASSSSTSGNITTMPTGIRRAGGAVSPTAHIDGTDDRVNADVAIIDTGIDLTHPDLNVVHHIDMIRRCAEDSSGCGNDDNGHGSHVAGTIGALDNNSGPVGMAPGANLWAVKVLDSGGSGSMSDIIAGIDYVTAHASQIDVVNMSLGCECTSSALNSAISRAINAGVVFAVAAGNSAKDAKTFSPANHPDVITVSALSDFNGQPGGGAGSTCRSDVDDTFADFSNYGQAVDIAAPGVCIFSAWKNGGTNTISGTSMASPHVAGAAALYLATHSKPATAGEVAAVKQALINEAWVQNGTNGFSGDKDSYKEPVLNVSSF